MQRCLIGVFLLILSLLSLKSAAAGQEDRTGRQSVAQRLNEKARIARQTGSEPDIRTAVDEAINSSVLANTDWAQTIKDRVGSAEIEFRRGAQKAVTEKDVVSTVNYLAIRLNAPDYARTSVEQVRMLRTALMARCPNVIGTLPDENKHISSAMSPLEGLYVTLSLIHQKLYNAAFQVTPDEWHQQRYGSRSRSSSRPRQGGPQLQIHGASDRSVALKRAITDAAASYGRSDLNDVLQRALSALGLEEVQR